MKAKDIMPRSAANVTADVLLLWQNDYKSVFEINVPKGDGQEGGYKGWIRKPNRNEMRELTSKKTDPVTYSEIVLDMLWLGGDEEIKTVDEVFYGAMGVIQNVMDIPEASLKKV